MKKICVSFIVLVAVALGTISKVSAQVSPNTVRYHLTYNQYSRSYTVWLHPNYTTPNAHNTNDHEFSFTAQVSLKVPQDFTITDINDIRGVWKKNPRKTGDSNIDKDLASEKYDKTARYYTIGKSPSYDDFGKFTPGDSVALFTFKGETTGQIEILAPNDPYISAASNATALNVACSFNSRSGQPNGVHVTPLEQFIDRKTPLIINTKKEPIMPIALDGPQKDEKVISDEKYKSLTQVKKTGVSGED